MRKKTKRRHRNSPERAAEIVQQPAAQIVQRSVSQFEQAPFARSYTEFLEALKKRIRETQIRAVLSVNQQLIRLYWDIGRGIVERQQREGWGKAVIERLAADLRREFPDLTGFSPRNIWFMRAFYLAYTEDVRNLKQPVSELDSLGLPQAVAEIPWGHNIVLMQKLDSPAQRLWYARETIANGWSRNVLVHQIESGLHLRQGQAVTNFEHTLPAPQSDLARQLLKDPYNFDFLSLGREAQERELHRDLLEHLREFLLELGVGFAFVGSEYRLEVSAKEYFLDLLFYHLRLRCFVVIELKVGEFEPEFAGKMNFYLAAVDDQMRHADDPPSIGIILCKSKDKLTVEYALRDTRKPIGVAAYKLATTLPKHLVTCLPSVKQLELELELKASEVKKVRKGKKESD